MKLVDICYLNLDKQQKKIFIELYPIESRIIKKSIWSNISIYSKMKKIYVIHGKTKDETDYSYRCIGYYTANSR